MKLIKYVKNEHFEGLQDSGSIRIGTLKNFRSSEHGEMVSDSMEGSKRLTGSYQNVTAGTVHKSKSLSSLIKMSNRSSIGTLEMSNYVIEEPDFYIFSLAQGYSENDHSKWFEKEQYDASYKILAPNTFFRRITRTLESHRSVRFLGLFEVHYYNEDKGMDFFDSKESFPAFSMKNYDGFSDQKEIRAVWQPLSKKPIEPINLNVPGLSSSIEFNKSIG